MGPVRRRIVPSEPHAVTRKVGKSVRGFGSSIVPNQKNAPGLIAQAWGLVAGPGRGGVGPAATAYEFWDSARSYTELPGKILLATNHPMVVVKESNPRAT